MRDLPSLVALYTKLDGILDSERAAALIAGDPARIERCQYRMRLNDQAYFLICWGQLELEIDDACRTAIRAKRNSPDWLVRRGWDFYNQDDKRLSGLAFEERVAIVLDKSGPYWTLVLKYYAVRKQIAHGRLRSEAIDVAAVSTDFYAIQAALTR